MRPAEGLVEMVGDQLQRRCLDLLRMARRADQLVFGHDNVSLAIRATGTGPSQPGVLVTASDASPRAVRDADRLAAANADLARVGCLTADELGQPVDRERVVHLLVKPGRLAARFLQEATRLAGMRPEMAQETGRS